MPPLRASILVIGDELLGGFVADANSGWLAGRLRALGVPLDRIVTVPDELDAIGEALTTELGRDQPRVVLTSGGIGSTPDDLTYEAIARTLGRELVTHPELDRRIAELLAEPRWEQAPAAEAHAASMRKMARVPAGAYLVADIGGLAPGVCVDVDGGSDAGGVAVVILPGIPSELRRIMLEAVEPSLLDGRGHPRHVAEIVHGYPESTLNPLLDQLVTQFPDLHVGSYPGRECVVRLQGGRERVEQAAVLVRRYVDELDEAPGAARLRSLWRGHWD